MGKFVVRPTPTGFVFHLLAGNGETVAVSEVYTSRAACRKSAQAMARCGKEAAVALPQAPLPANPRYEVFPDRNGAFRFRLRARNGKIIAVSQKYSALAACVRGIDSVCRNLEELSETIDDE